MDSIDLIEQLQQQGNMADSIVKELLEKNLVVDLDFSGSDAFTKEFGKVYGKALMTVNSFHDLEDEELVTSLIGAEKIKQIFQLASKNTLAAFSLRFNYSQAAVGGDFIKCQSSSFELNVLESNFHKIISFFPDIYVTDTTEEGYKVDILISFFENENVYSARLSVKFTLMPTPARPEPSE